MTWTSTQPATAGYYWWRREGYDPRVLRVVAWPGGGLAVHLPQLSRHSDGICTISDIGGEWWGPLEVPR